MNILRAALGAALLSLISVAAFAQCASSSGDVVGAAGGGCRVIGLQLHAVSQAPPADGQALVYNGAQQAWVPQATSGTITVPVTVSNGGTGDTSLPAGSLLVGAGTSPITGLAPVNGDCVVGAGGAWTAAACPGAGSTAFSTITAGTNTAALVIGGGGSLGRAGGGTIDASTLLAATWAAPGAIGGTTPAAGSFSSLTDTGITGSTQCLHVNTSGLISGTGSDCGSSGGGSAFSTITGGTNTTAAMVVGSGATLGATGSGTITATAAPLSGITGLGAGVATALAIAPNAAGGLVSVPTTATGISAAGTTQGTATVLTTDWAEVSTVSAGQGVVQNTPVAGKSQLIANNSGTTLLVYPVSGGTFDTLSANTAVSVGALARVRIFCFSTTHCDTK